MPVDPVEELLATGDSSPDYEDDVAREVVRCTFEGRRAVAVAGRAKARQQVGALLDLLELNLAHDPEDELAVLVGAGASAEATEALRTLRDAVRGPAVRVLAVGQHGQLQDLPPGAPDLSDPAASGWSRWPAQLLSATLPDRSADGTTMRALEQQLRDDVVRGRAELPLRPVGAGVRVRWSSTGPAHEVDAVMADGDVPVAVQVARQTGTGTGQRYRRAVGEAVLARHFLRHAAAYDPWFERHGLDRLSCRAAVVIGAPDYHQRQWTWRTERLARLLDVTVHVVAS